MMLAQVPMPSATSVTESRQPVCLRELTNHNVTDCRRASSSTLPAHKRSLTIAGPRKTHRSLDDNN